jgi:NAD(P)-dependent dehydrogenase (short-subunit alcohol dehydrogenase family)
VNLPTTTSDSPAYRVSKVSFNLLTRVLAAELEDTRIVVHVVHAASPGHTRTDMSPSAIRSAAQGVETPGWRATPPADGATGGLFRQRASLAW